MIFLKLFKESFLFAFHALVSNKLRTFLSLLGISIGIFAIISVFTVVDALEANFRNSVASLGSNVIYVQKWPWAFDEDYPWWKYLNRPLPSLGELEEIQKRSTASEAAALIASFNNRTVKYGNNQVENIAVSAASHDYERIKAFELRKGRYFTESESRSGRAIAIIGADVANNLFPLIDPIGKEIIALGRKLTVIGIFKKEGESIFGSADNEILVPIEFARGVVDIRSDRAQPFIMVKGKEQVTNPELIDELKGMMRSIRKLRPKEEDNFALNQSSLISSQLDAIFNILGKAGWIIGGFSILVGGFGIANIMFVSVKERTNIIGIQKSLGAKNYFILLQFLIESVVLCIFGGAIGLSIVFGGTLLLGLIDLDISLTKENIILGLGVSGIIGVISGFLPAMAASQMDPVEAIRTV